MTIGYKQVMEALPQLNAVELADVMDRASTLLKKVIGSAPSKKVGTTPHQLERNHEWTKFVLADATMNGWESFVMRTSKTNKDTEEKEVTEVSLRESVETEGGHVFADTGKSMSQGQAMCYGKLLRDRDDPIWKDFEAQYEQVAAPKASTVKVVKKTSQEVQEEKMAKEQKKEEEKKKKEEKKEEEKKKKEEEKKKKEEEKAAKEAAKKPVVKAGIVMPQPRLRSPAPAPAPAPAVAVVAAVAEAVPVEEEAEMPALEPLPVAVVEKVVEKAVVKAVAPAKKKIVQVKQVVQARPEVDPFDAGEAGEKQWEWKGKTYIRYADNLMYLWDQENDEYGAFQGRYNYEKDVIEECEEPLTE